MALSPTEQYIKGFMTSLPFKTCKRFKGSSACLVVHRGVELPASFLVKPHGLRATFYNYYPF